MEEIEVTHTVEHIYICDEHGVGKQNCCKEAENAGWMETISHSDKETA